MYCGQGGRPSALAAPRAVTPTQSPLANNPDRDDRLAKLMHVFEEFDVHQSGAIEPGQLLELGKMRRSLGHRAGEWDETKNDKLIWKMDSDADGRISADEFCWYFEAALARDVNEFDEVVAQFLQVARQLNKGCCPLLPAHCCVCCLPTVPLLPAHCATVPAHRCLPTAACPLCHCCLPTAASGNSSTLHN